MKRSNLKKCVYVLTAITVFAFANEAYAQEKAETKPVPCPATASEKEMHKAHQDCAGMPKASGNGHSNHQAMLMNNGEKEMGFSQTQTTHHFLIMKDGGVIQVEVNASADSANRDKIRSHLKEIAQQFQAGIYSTPFAVHGQVPPGVPAMDQLKDDIKYQYEETQNGARVRISTDNPQALAAIQAFLKFQIGEHKTGDPLPSQN